MRNPGGYAVIISPNSQVVNFDHLRREQVSAGNYETDTFTCFHCNTVVHVAAKMDPANLGGLCKQCMKMICPRCLDKGCTPFEKKLEAMEKRDIALRSYGI